MPDLLTPFFDAAILLPVMILFVRLSGLRSFSKMSAYDFAVTVSFGSTLAAVVVNPGVTLWQGTLALCALFLVQWIVGYLRTRSDMIEGVVDNTPLLLVREGEVLEENLRAARICESDLFAKLREANCLSLSAARAVVLETTGDVSVLHGEDALDDRLLAGVRT